jgi:hypothetical protein
MRPDEIEGLTGEFKPNMIHEIRCPIRLERPGGYRKMLQQPSLELQLFVGFGKLPCPFRDPALDFICNPLWLIQALCLIDSHTQSHVLVLDAVIQPLAPAFTALTVNGISHRSLKIGLLVSNGYVECRRDGFLGKVD